MTPVFRAVLCFGVCVFVRSSARETSWAETLVSLVLAATMLCVLTATKETTP